MAAATACDVDLLLVSGTHNGTAAGIVTAFFFGFLADLVKIRGEGVKGPSCIGWKGSDYIAWLEYMVGPPIPEGNYGSLVVVSKKMDGTTSRTRTLLTCKAFDWQLTFDRENPSAERYHQIFQYQGDAATSPYSEA